MQQIIIFQNLFPKENYSSQVSTAHVPCLSFHIFIFVYHLSEKRGLAILFFDPNILLFRPTTNELSSTYPVNSIDEINFQLQE